MLTLCSDWHAASNTICGIYFKVSCISTLLNIAVIRVGWRKGDRDVLSGPPQTWAFVHTEDIILEKGKEEEEKFNWITLNIIPRNNSTHNNSGDQSNTLYN